MEPTTQVVTTTNHSTTVRSAGAGRPLLFLHAEANTSAWSEVHDLLSEDFLVYAPVHPGFGGETIPSWLHDMSDLVFHYVDLIRALDLDQPLIVGASLGGWIALDLAIHRSDLMSALLLVGGLGLRPIEPMPDLFIKAGPEALSYLSQSIDGADVDPLTGDITKATDLWVEQAAQARLMWERPYDRRLEQRAHHVECPSSVLWGGADRLLPVEHGHRLADLIHADFSAADGAGHLVNLDAPLAVAEAVRALAERSSTERGDR